MPAGQSGARRTWIRLQGHLRSYRSDDRGTAAVEFAIIALPFLALLAGMVSISLYYFQVSSVENAAWQAARAIRTGQLQQSSGAYSGLTTDSQRKAALKTAFCAYAPALSDCANKTTIIVQSNTAFSSITTPSCATGGALVSDTSAAFVPGGTSSVVLITVCYAWALGGKLPYLKLGTLNDGSFLIQASVAFRTEPY